MKKSSNCLKTQLKLMKKECYEFVTIQGRLLKLGSNKYVVEARLISLTKEL